MISKYYGNPDKYLDFMNQYENAIHNNPSLSDIDEFNYLTLLLGGIATNAVSGFSLTEKNYATAITLLKQRFENQDMLIHAHLNNLLNISPIKNISDTHGLRNLSDKCETLIRSLDF
ncbi:integrase catalytic domain-containing protein [Nephila pilipes]|uniref:Integrase catalytic domain-containing protein n=1 Tax=Nephila pilipes TaxID=299642 RepID=A0A8X6N959_NEPPI|nr:integrase catalytic domain-containing protein [Nephila pilipes]